MVISFVLALTLTTTGAQGTLPGFFCFAETGIVDQNSASCIETSSRRLKLDVASAEQDRPYIWFSGDGSEVTLGVVRRAVTRVADEPSDQTIVTTTFQPSDEKRWPAVVQVSVKSSVGPEWRFELIAGATDRLKRITLPRGKYEMNFIAAHHAQARAKVVADSPLVKLDRLFLRRFPEVKGRVVNERTAEPIGGATITADQDRILTTTDAGGEWSVEIDEKWPKFLTISSPGLGSRILTLPQIASDMLLPPVGLRPAGSLLLKIVGDRRDELELEFLFSNDSGELMIARRSIRPEETDLMLEDLAAGNYRIEIKGPKPLQRFGRRVMINPGDIAVEEVSIEPAELSVHVVQGDTAVSAEIELTNFSGGWKSRFLTDASVTAVEEFWQGGDFTAFVTAQNRPAPYVTHRHLTLDTKEWTIPLPDHRLRGVVRNARSGKPIAGAIVYLEARLANSEMQTSRMTDEGGLFEFSFLDPGIYALTAFASGYLSKKLSVPEPTIDALVISLDPGVEQRIAVRTTTGAPVIGAMVVDESGSFLVPIFTDGNGGATVAGSNDTRKFFIFPREGSFTTFSLVPGKTTSEPRQVVIPAGDAEIVILTRSTAGSPIRNVPMLVRFNGETLSPAVQHAMQRQQGRWFVTDSTGIVRLSHLPIGLYEIWPIFQDQDWILAANGVSPPAARLATQPGENRVTLTFEPKP